MWRQAIGTKAQPAQTLQEETAARAYTKSLERPDSQRAELDDWLAAERELLGEIHTRIRPD